MSTPDVSARSLTPEIRDDPADRFVGATRPHHIDVVGEHRPVRGPSIVGRPHHEYTGVLPDLGVSP